MTGHVWERHHRKYKSIHGVDEKIGMTISEHRKLHSRLGKKYTNYEDDRWDDKVDMRNIRDVCEIEENKPMEDMWRIVENTNIKNDMRVEFVPFAKCPKFLEVLECMFSKEQIVLLQEWFGCGIAKWIRADKFLVIIDKQDVTTLILEILVKLYGDLYGCPRIIRCSMEEKVDKGKLMNCYHYLGRLSYFDEEYISRMTGNYLLYNTKLMIIDNHALTFKSKRIDFRKSFYDRLMLIVLDGNCNKKEYYKKLDIFKSEMNSELPGILCWVLKGLNRLIENGKFSYNVSSDEKQKLWESEQVGGESYNKFWEEVK